MSECLVPYTLPLQEVDREPNARMFVDCQLRAPFVQQWQDLNRAMLHL